LTQKINRCIQDKRYYGDLLEHTEADGSRYIFDWGKGWMEQVRPMIKLKT